MSDTDTPEADSIDAESHRIELVGIHSMNVNPVNPKLHDLPAIIDSIKINGFVTPAVTDERTGYLIAGHGRREALLALWARDKEFPPSNVVVREDEDYGYEWYVPTVRGWKSNDDDHAKRMLVADNQTTILAGWDDEKLAEILSDLNASNDGYALEGTGFSSAELDKMLSLADGAPDEFPEVTAEDIPQGIVCPRCSYEIPKPS